MHYSSFLILLGASTALARGGGTGGRGGGGRPKSPSAPRPIGAPDDPDGFGYIEPVLDPRKAASNLDQLSKDIENLDYGVEVVKKIIEAFTNDITEDSEETATPSTRMFSPYHNINRFKPITFKQPHQLPLSPSNPTQHAPPLQTSSSPAPPPPLTSTPSPPPPRPHARATPLSPTM